MSLTGKTGTSKKYCLSFADANLNEVRFGTNHRKGLVERKLTKMERAHKVGFIENGIAIDHLPQNTALKIISVLGLKDERKALITLAINLDTKKQASGKKDLVKIENKMLSDRELDKVAIIAPNATVNIIRNGEVVKKLKIKIPDVIEKAIKCGNPACITHVENASRFIKHKDKLKCYYCEKVFALNEIELL